MLRSFRLTTIDGIEVNVHPTFGLVLLWAVWQWGLGPGSSFESLFLGLVLVFLTFVSILLHELGHCAMAQEFDVRVLDITLWPFGGVARIEQMPTQPRTEFLVSVAGPLTSLAIAVLMLPWVTLIGVLGGWEALVPGGEPFSSLTPSSVLAYLLLINLLVMAFNLLPAFPFDGGRILRSALVPGMGRERATRVAVTAGVIFAGIFLLVGIWERQIVLVMLGVFVFFAAQAEARVERVQSGLRRLRVGQYALWDMGGVAPSDTLRFALRGGPRDMVVTSQGRVVGMLWRSRLLDSLAGGIEGRTVSDVMEPVVYVADVNDSVQEVQRQMSLMNRWAVPVTENGRYRGIFTADRFVHLYRQLSPGGSGSRLVSDDWKEAIIDTLSFWKHYRRR